MAWETSSSKGKLEVKISTLEVYRRNEAGQGIIGGDFDRSKSWVCRSLRQEESQVADMISNGVF